MKVHKFEVDLDGRKLTIETGKLAKQAGGSVVVRWGDSVVLVSATSAARPKPNQGFFPLTCDYREYTYAAGKIPGGYIKREGRMSEKGNAHQPDDRPAHAAPCFQQATSPKPRSSPWSCPRIPNMTRRARHRRSRRRAGDLRYSVPPTWFPPCASALSTANTSPTQLKDGDSRIEAQHDCGG